MIPVQFAAEPDPLTGGLLQYGAIGIVALLACAAVRVLFARLIAQIDRETQRGDRLEEELRRLNETIRSEYVNAIVRSAGAINDANRAVADAAAAVRRS